MKDTAEATIEARLKRQAYEEKLQELSLFMGEVFKDSEARKELFGFARLEGNENDVEYNLRRLFEEDWDPVGRKRSAIVNAFNRQAENYRMKGEAVDIDELIAFINENDIGVLAPYLAENFDPDKLSELTVSWWTEEMEQEGLEEDPDWEGETPGIKLRLNEEGQFINFRKSVIAGEEMLRDQLVMTNDQYAIEHPTVVFGAFGDDELIFPPIDDPIGGGTVPPSQPVSSYVNSARCEELDENTVVRLEMPEFKLTSSIRSWPHPDKLTVIVVLGTNPGGSAYSDLLLDERKVTRGNTGKWLKSNISFLINNWQDRQVDMRLVVFNRRPWKRETVTTTVNVKVDSQGNTELQSTTVGGWKRSQRHFNQTFNRCGTILDPFTAGDYGQRKYNDKDYRVERFGKFEFYLVPKIYL